MRDHQPKLEDAALKLKPRVKPSPPRLSLAQRHSQDPISASIEPLPNGTIGLEAAASPTFTSSWGKFCWALAAALAFSAYLLAPLAVAQDADDAEDAQEEDVEEVVVTGSLIRGTPIDAASPVSAFDREDLEEQGSPSVVDLVRNLSESTGLNVGDTNQFQANAGEGLASINLRGLGASRTLVLMNGRRLPYAPYGFGEFVNLRTLPSIALRRVEVLKEGAAATYGSDAVGGVANFLTRDKFRGLEISGNYSDIDAGGDYEAGVIVGTEVANGRGNFVFSLGVQQRDEVTLPDRDWAIRELSENPQGGWSTIGNPGTYLPAPGLAGLVGRVTDPNCNSLGGTAFGNFCRFQYTAYDNLVENEEHLQAYVEYSHRFAGGMRLHIDLLVSESEVPDYKTSPSYPPQELLGDTQFIPSTHPGLVDYLAKNPSLTALRNGARFWGRLFGSSGKLGNPNGAELGERAQDLLRFTADFGFTPGRFDIDLGFTYASAEGTLLSRDALVENTYLAFRGYGGPNCNVRVAVAADGTLSLAGTAGKTAGEGNCLYYNPFPSGFQTVQTPRAPGANPNYEENLVNSQAVIDYLIGEITQTRESTLAVFEFLAQTRAGSFNGGDGRVAFGVQYRQNEYSLTGNDLSNLDVSPCPYSGQDALTDCGPRASRTGRFSFLAGAFNSEADLNITSAFAEYALPLAENFDLQLSARYEDYSSGADSFDPKVSLRWQASDFFTLRASAGTTFRGPTVAQVAENGVTTVLEFVSQTFAFKAVDTFANPDLEPESATAFNIGAVFEWGSDNRFLLTADYFSTELEDTIQAEPFNSIISTYESSRTALVADPSDAAAQARFDAVKSQISCQGGVSTAQASTACAASGLSRVAVNFVNGASRTIEGVDLTFSWSRSSTAGEFLLAYKLTQLLTYDVGAYVKDGVQIEAAFDALGFYNFDSKIYSVPETKHRIQFKYGRGRHQINYFFNNTSSYTDRRAAAGFADFEIEDHITHDLNYAFSYSERGRLFVSVQNLTDEDPPLARSDLSYDPFVHNGLGRVVKVGTRYRF